MTHDFKEVKFYLTLNNTCTIFKVLEINKDCINVKMSTGKRCNKIKYTKQDPSSDF